MSAEVSAFRTVLAAAILSLPVSILRSLTRVGTDLSGNNGFIVIIIIIICCCCCCCYFSVVVRREVTI